MKHSYYEIWKEGYAWKLQLHGRIASFGTKRQAEAYKWACLRPGKR